MQIDFNSQIKNDIADLLWEIQDLETAKEVAHSLGEDGIAVFHMLVATMLDECDETDLVDEIIEQCKRIQ
jgi:hypothetical protein